MSRKKKAKIVKPLPPKLEEVCAHIPDSIKDVKLARAINGLPYKEVTVARFCELMADEQKNRKEIAQFVYDRFHQRYLLPFEILEREAPKGKSGFAQMAVCCLMIEAMESFRNGWNDTMDDAKDEKCEKIPGRKIFCNFFSHFDDLKEFQEIGSEFYRSIRCGILHQAESQNGWRIVRTKGVPLLNVDNRTINPTIFRRRMKKALQAYCDELKSGNETVWEQFKTKMAYIILNCKLEPIEKDASAFPLVAKEVITL